MKKFNAFIAAFVLSCVSVFAMGSDCQDAQASCPDKAPKKQQARRGKNQKARPRTMKLTEEQKAQIKLFKETVEAYKKDKTPENKAKLAELVGKMFDKNVAAMEKRAANMKKSAADLEKKTAEMKANRDAEIEKMIERIVNRKPRARRSPGKPADKAPAKAAAPAK